MQIARWTWCARVPHQLQRQVWRPLVHLARSQSTAAGVSLEWSYLHQQSDSDSMQDRCDPVVVMHGLLGNKMNWRTLFRSGALGELNRDVIVADARNHGASPHHPEMNYGGMVDDVLRILDEQEIDRVVAVGHSMGGKTAMQLALRASDRVERLVVCDIAPVTCVPRFDVPLYRNASSVAAT